MPVAPAFDDGSAATAQRNAAEQAAIADSKANGRRSTYGGSQRSILDSRQANEARKVLG